MSSAMQSFVAGRAARCKASSRKAGKRQLTLLVLGATLLAHDWYPRDCCGGQDCRPVDCSEISVGTNGQFGLWLGKYSLNKVRQSPDGKCHVCAAGFEVYCIFVPGAVS